MQSLLERWIAWALRGVGVYPLAPLEIELEVWPLVCRWCTMGKKGVAD